MSFKQQIEVMIVSVALMLIITSCVYGAVTFAASRFVHAAPAAKSSPEPGDCSHFATNGPIEVLRCVDPQTGGVLYINNVGMMTAGD